MSHSSELANRRLRFEETAIPFLKPVYNVALRLARRPDDARDLAQETYLRAFRTFDSFRAGTDCRAWLLTILHSVFVNAYWKRKRRGETVSLDLVEARLPTASARETEAGMLRAAGLEPPGAEVVQALERLPEAFRAAVLLVDVEEMRYEEAAAVLQCPVGTLRSRLFRARKLLFETLHGYASAAGYAKGSIER